MVNRKDSDGEIINFRKDGTTVGTIGTHSGGGTYFYSNSGSDSGLTFWSNVIAPSTSSGGFRDAVTDLGASGGRFKDLFLSGGVSFDDNPSAVTGNVSSKTLDDYEEGTFTPVFEPSTGSFAAITMDVVQARYTKVGNVVTINAYIRTDNLDVTGGSGIVKITGLPFSAYSSSSANIGFASGFNTAPAGGYVFDTRINLTKPTSGGSTSLSSVADLTDGALTNKNEIVLTATYHTAA
jgi:hypothetical protein